MTKKSKNLKTIRYIFQKWIDGAPGSLSIPSLEEFQETLYYKKPGTSTTWFFDQDQKLKAMSIFFLHLIVTDPSKSLSISMKFERTELWIATTVGGNTTNRELEMILQSLVADGLLTELPKVVKIAKSDKPFELLESDQVIPGLHN